MYLKFRLQSCCSTPQLGSVVFGQTDKKNFSFAKKTKAKRVHFVLNLNSNFYIHPPTNGQGAYSHNII